MIKDATNSFSEGMITDVNPNNMPNTALTDCVNGTTLTYNGNEYSLQNDMGNCKLKSVYLGEGFIPVGMKEYGGILYIVSYNPKDDLTEIGSYPSTFIHQNDGDGRLLYKDIRHIDWSIEEKYSNLLKTRSLQVFVNDDQDKEIYKINPGDVLKITKTQGEYKTESGEETDELIESATAPDLKYQKPEFYIMDETRNLTSIDEYINDYIETKAETISELLETKWRIPGWLAVKLSFLSFDNLLTDFELTTAPKFKNEGTSSNVVFDLSYRLLMSDGFYTESDKDDNSKITVKVSFDKDVLVGDSKESVEELALILEENKTDLPNGQYYFNTESAAITWNAKRNEQLKITATPYVGNVEYDTFESTYVYTADATVFDPDKLAIGDTTFLYTTTAESLVLNFNTSGAQNAVGATLAYDLYRIGEISNDWIKIVSDKTVDDWKKASTINTSLTIPFVEYTSSFDETKDVVAEDIYKIVFKINYNGETVERSRIIVATELMNEIDEQLYYNLTLDKWLPNYEKHIECTGVKITDATITPENEVNIENNDWFLELNNSPICINYKGFVEDSYNINDKKEIDITQRYTGKINTVSSDLVLPHGPLWNRIDLSLKSFVDNKLAAEYKVDKYTGKITLDKTYDFENKIKTESEYSLNFINGNTTVCYDFTDNTLNIGQERVLKDAVSYVKIANSATGKVNKVPYTITRTIEDAFNNTLTNLGYVVLSKNKTASDAELVEMVSNSGRFDIITPVYYTINVWDTSESKYTTARTRVGKSDGQTIFHVWPQNQSEESTVSKALIAIRTDRYNVFFLNALEKYEGYSTYVPEINWTELEKVANGIAQNIYRFERGKIYTGGFININQEDSTLKKILVNDLVLNNFKYDFSEINGLLLNCKNLSGNVDMQKIMFSSDSSSVLENVEFNNWEMQDLLNTLNKNIDTFNNDSSMARGNRTGSEYYSGKYLERETVYHINKEYNGQAKAKLDTIVNILNSELKNDPYKITTVYSFLKAKGDDRDLLWSTSIPFGTSLASCADPLLPTDFE